jgi:hypothetical protein
MLFFGCGPAEQSFTELECLHQRKLIVFERVCDAVVTTGRQAAGGGGDTSDFVSSVCWKKDSNVLLAANSQGTINIMSLE